MDRQDLLTDVDSLIADLPVAVYRTTPDGRIVAGNEALARLLGAGSMHELFAVDVRSLYVDPAVRDQIISRAVRGVEIPPVEIEIRRLDGRPMWVRVSSRGILDSDGNVGFIVGALEDVTAARATATELVQSNALLDTLTRVQNRYIAGVEPGLLFDELLDDLLSMTGSKHGFISQLHHDETGSPFLRAHAAAWKEETGGAVTDRNPDGLELRNLDALFGWVVADKSAIISNDPQRDPRPRSRPGVDPPLEALVAMPILKGADVLGVIALANRPSGYTEAIVDSLEPLVATVGSMIEAIRNDDARLAAEARERNREELYRAIVAYAVEAVIVFRNDGTIEAFNPAAEHMTGFSEAEMLGRDVAELVSPDYVQRLREAAGGTSSDRTTTELLMLRRDGSDVPVEVSFGRTELDSRSLTTAMVRSIGERKAIEAALRDAKEAAERASRAKDEFLAGMSHELRTPLNAVIGLSSILGREVHGKVNDKQREYVTQIESAGRHLLELINDILDLAKIEADKMEPALASVELAPLVSAAAAVVREAVFVKQLQLHIDVDSDLPPMIADARRTKQVLINLLSNAVKFTEAGGSIGVRARVNGDLLEVVVWDTGVGIPGDRLEDIFAPFQQLDSSVSRAHDGSGLGLALSRKFVEIQGGSVSVTSRPGRGSEFTFSVPLESAALVRAEPPTASASSVVAPAAEEPSDAHVLVVEDNAVNRLLITDYLEAHGFGTDVAVDGIEAGRKARELMPDVILMDIQLPRLDGLSATRDLKADPVTRRIPVIALTALAMKGDAERCLEAGCDSYLSKPCDPADVLEAVQSALAGERRRARSG